MKTLNGLFLIDSANDFRTAKEGDVMINKNIVYAIERPYNASKEVYAITSNKERVTRVMFEPDDPMDWDIPNEIKNDHQSTVGGKIMYDFFQTALSNKNGVH